MHATEPRLCKRCHSAFLKDLQPLRGRGGAMRTWWCEHELALAVCVIENGFIARWALEGPIDPEEADAYRAKIEADFAGNHAPAN